MSTTEPKELLSWSVVETDEYQWAREQACKRAGESFSSFEAGILSVGISNLLRHLAQMVATYETKPIDPALKAARECADQCAREMTGLDKTNWLSGDADASIVIETAKLAYNRALEERGE